MMQRGCLWALTGKASDAVQTMAVVAVFPSAEAYCAATPPECVPFLGIGAGARPLLHTEATFRRARAFASNPQRLDCVAGHVRLDLRNVVANYPFEKSLRFAGIQPNSGHRDYSRLSCGDGGYAARA